MSVFDKYSLLDPAKMLREIDAETDGNTFTNMSILDPEFARRQMRVAGIEVSNAALLDPALLLIEVDAALEAEAEPDDAPETTAFLARTSGLDATHVDAYKVLINGLVEDGVFAKFDALYVLATQDATTALLNLVSSDYNATAVNAPTFTADEGYQGVATSYLNTNFDPTTAVSPQFTQNSAHWSLWNNTNDTTNVPCMSQTTGDNIYISIGGTIYFRINDDVESSGYAHAIGDCTGLLVGNRSASNAIEGYQNGALLGTATGASKAVEAFDVIILSGNSQFDTVHQIAAASIGSSLSAGDVSNFYDRLNTYMQAIVA